LKGTDLEPARQNIVFTFAVNSLTEKIRASAERGGALVLTPGDSARLLPVLGMSADPFYPVLKAAAQVCGTTTLKIETGCRETEVAMARAVAVTILRERGNSWLTISLATGFGWGNKKRDISSVHSGALLTARQYRERPGFILKLAEAKKVLELS